jgi:hypothetical protein
MTAGGQLPVYRKSEENNIAITTTTATALITSLLYLKVTEGLDK